MRLARTSANKPREPAIAFEVIRAGDNRREGERRGRTRQDASRNGLLEGDVSGHHRLEAADLPLERHHVRLVRAAAAAAAAAATEAAAEGAEAATATAAAAEASAGAGRERVVAGRRAPHVAVRRVRLLRLGLAVLAVDNTAQQGGVARSRQLLRELCNSTRHESASAAHEARPDCKGNCVRHPAGPWTWPGPWRPGWARWRPRTKQRKRTKKSPQRRECRRSSPSTRPAADPGCPCQDLSRNPSRSQNPWWGDPICCRTSCHPGTACACPCPSADIRKMSQRHLHTPARAAYLRFRVLLGLRGSRGRGGVQRGLAGLDVAEALEHVGNDERGALPVVRHRQPHHLQRQPRRVALGRSDQLQQPAPQANGERQAMIPIAIAMVRTGAARCTCGAATAFLRNSSTVSARQPASEQPRHTGAPCTTPVEGLMYTHSACING